MRVFNVMPQLIIFCQLVLPAMLFLIHEEHRSHFLPRVVCSLLMSVLVLLLYRNIPVLFSRMIKDIAGYYLTYCLVMLFVWFVYNISVLSAVFLSSCCYALQHIAFCLGNLLLDGANHQMPYEIFSLLSPLVLALAFYFLVLRRNRYVYRNADYRQVLMSMVVLIICIALSSLRHSETGGIFYMNLYDLLLCACCLMLQFSMSYSAKVHEENKTLELLINQQHEQHKLSAQAFDMLNIKIHNIRHQLTSIQQVMEEKDSEKLRSFMRTLQIYDTMANTGNATLDAVLMEKGLMCEINHIRFSYIVDGKQMDFMEVADLFSLVNNILDNAIESELKEADVERRIMDLRIVRNHDMILLDAGNYCRYPVDVQDNMIQTTKPDKENHGLGMRGIDYVVKKYGGERVLSQNDDLFRIQIVFPVKTE